ncbi:pyridoxal-phosphate-dependent aminotransferase family protein [Microbaculum sp. FT89]|uniref:pyridoxal-phosphate-dependent aminotransferase family protein n=1 Tax=Microbaculum sp. FT89 TaxID=3447298 RepID=UPI003F533FCB
MTVRTGRDVLGIPGPTTIPDEVLSAMHRPAIQIYTGELVEYTDSILRDLKGIFRTEGRAYIYASNGHGAWEAALTNILSRGDRVLVLESGRFAHNWGEMARMLGVEIETLEGTWRHAVDPAAVEERLKADTEGRIKAVLVVQIDTASGVVNDIPAIRAAIDAAGHDALFLVDTIASLACMPYEMDAWKIDVTVSAAQKGLMTPPGLGFVAANDKALAAHKTADLRTLYWDWTAREGELHYQKYCGTPPEHLLFGQRAALDILLGEGLENAWNRHRLLAGATHRAVETWAEGGALEFNILDPQSRSASITAVLVGGGFDVAAIQAYCLDKCNVTVGGGIGDLKGKALRIAHMGYANAPMVLGMLASIDMALKALKIPHGPGAIQAAVDYLGDNVPA